MADTQSAQGTVEYERWPASLPEPGYGEGGGQSQRCCRASLQQMTMLIQLLNLCSQS